MTNSKNTQEIDQEIISTINYLENQVVENQSRYFSYRLIDLLINMTALNQENTNEFVKWLEFAKNYFFKLNPSNDIMSSDYELFKIEFYRYIISLIDNKPDLNFVKKYCDLVENYVLKHFKLNKENIEFYEKLAMVRLETKEIDKAYELFKKMISVNEKGHMGLILDYSFEKTNTNQAELIKKYRTFLKRKADDVLEDTFFYFSYYYREMLKIDSSKEIFKGLVFGVV